MKQHWKNLPVLVAALLIASSPVLAHEQCDEADNKGASAAGSEIANPQSRSQANITIKVFQFQPARMQVNAGTTVTWVNEDEILHTVTTDKKENGFDAPLDGKGKNFTFAFTQPGIYTYHCDRHEHMRGEIEVR